MFSITRFLLLLLYVLLLPSVLCAIEPNFVRIGTASISGVYYTTGNALCRFVQKQSYADDSFNMFCSVQSTPGAMYNLNALRGGDLEIAIAQSDWEYFAYNGTGVFEKIGPMKNLRALFTTHKEAFSVMVRRSSGINTFDDIKGKVVNIGAPGTGVRGTIEAVMSAKGWTLKDFKLATELSSSEQAQALCDGKIDVMVNVIGHPNGIFQEAAATCDTKFIGLDKKTLDQLLLTDKYYSYYEVPTKTYIGENDDIVPTIAVRSTFYTTSSFSDDDAYKILESVFSNFVTLRNTHPAFKDLTKSDLVPKESAAPIHDGAITYYKKIGLL